MSFNLCNEDNKMISRGEERKTGKTPPSDRQRIGSRLMMTKPHVGPVTSVLVDKYHGCHVRLGRTFVLA